MEEGPEEVSARAPPTAGDAADVSGTAVAEHADWRATSAATAAKDVNEIDIDGEGGCGTIATSAEAAEGDAGAGGGAGASKEDRRKLKKLRKQLAQGNLPSAELAAATAGTGGADTDLSALYKGLHASLDVRGRKGRDWVTGKEVQELLLWLAGSLIAMPQWVFVRNKALVNNVVVIILRDVTWQDWESLAATSTATSTSGGASSSDTALSRFLCAAGTHVMKLRHEKDQTWNAHQKVVQPIDAALLYAPRFTDKTGGGGGAAAGKKRGREQEQDDDDDGQLTQSLIRKRLLGLTLNRRELLIHGFPLAAPPTQPEDVRGVGSSLLTTYADTLPPGRVAGYADGHKCSLLIPRGFVLTRTAHADLHAAFPFAPPCPLLGPDHQPYHEVFSSRLYAVDCEMCTTAVGSQLARATLLDGGSEAITYDKVVKPTLPVTDHLTPYSGITPDMLAAADANMDTVQQEVCDILDGVESGSSGSGSGVSVADLKPAILVGHSLDSDLVALRIVHTRLIDTALCYPHPNGLPYRQSLRNLTRSILGRSIQAGHGSSGHDSIEDSLAALHLVQTLVADGGKRWDVEQYAEEGELPEAHTPIDPQPVASGGAGADSAAAAAAVAAEGEAPSEGADSSAASAAPAAKRAKTSNAGGRDPAPSPLPRFADVFKRTARDHLVPESQGSWGKDKDKEGSEEAGSGSGAGNLSVQQQTLGVAATLNALRPGASSTSGPPAAAAPPVLSTISGPLEQYVAQRRHVPEGCRSIFSYKGMSDPNCVCGVSVLGSTPFVNSHLAGSAGGMNCPATSRIGDLRRTTDKICAEIKRIARTRTEKKVQGAALVVAEARIPRELLTPAQAQAFAVTERLKEAARLAAAGDAQGAAAAAAAVGNPLNLSGPVLGPKDWRQLDEVLAGLASQLPANTAIMVCTQSDKLRYGQGRARLNTAAPGAAAASLAGAAAAAAAASSSSSGGDRMSDAANADANAAVMGVCFLHVVKETGKEGGTTAAEQ